MSFYTALTGLNGSSADISATSNNIANVGTTGFKRSRVEFGDIFATSPLQNSSSSIGSGTILKGVKQQFTQGNIASSLNALDLAISGQGFFALKPSLTSAQTVYTRNGSLNVNNDRYVVDSAGQYLLTYPVNDDGSVTAKDLASAVPLQLPVTSGEPTATSEVKIGVNVPASAEVVTTKPQFASGYQFNPDDPDTFTNSTSITIFDDLGNPTIATVYFIKTQASSANDPNNKYDTRLVINDTIIDPDLVRAVDDGGRSLFIDRFGNQTNEVPDDNYFLEGKGSPLYKLDDLQQLIPSQPAKIQAEQTSFDFGEEGDKLVEIVTDPMQFNATREAGQSGDVYWGKDFLLVNVDDSDQPVSIDIRPGKYNADQLAAEVERAINAAYGDDRKLQVVQNLDDVLSIDLQRLNADGTVLGLGDNPVTVNLLGTDSYVSEQIADLDITGASPDFTKEQFLAHAQVKINDALNDYARTNGASSLGVQNISFVRSLGDPLDAIYTHNNIVTLDRFGKSADVALSTGTIAGDGTEEFGLYLVSASETIEISSGTNLTTGMTATDVAELIANDGDILNSGYTVKNNNGVLQISRTDGEDFVINKSGNFTLPTSADFTVDGSSIGSGASSSSTVTVSAGGGLSNGETFSITLVTGSTTTTLNTTVSNTVNTAALVASALAADTDIDGSGYVVTASGAGVSITRPDGAAFTVATTENSTNGSASASAASVAATATTASQITTDGVESQYLVHSYYNNKPTLSVYTNREEVAGSTSENLIEYTATQNKMKVFLSANGTAGLSSSDLNSKFTVGENIRLSGKFADSVSNNAGLLNGREFEIVAVSHSGDSGNDTGRTYIEVSTTGLALSDNDFTIGTTGTTDGSSAANSVYVLADESATVEAFFEGSYAVYEGSQENYSSKKIVIRETGDFRTDLGGFITTSAAFSQTSTDLADLGFDKLSRSETSSHSTIDWVDEKDPAIKIGYDAVNQRLQYTVDRTVLGTGTDSNFSSYSIYGSPNQTGSNNIGIQSDDDAASVPIRGGEVLFGETFISDGEELQPNDKRYGIKVEYNSDLQNFSFSSGTTGEAISKDGALGVTENQKSSNIQVGRYTISNTDGTAIKTVPDPDATILGNGENQLMGLGPSKTDFIFTSGRGLKAQPAVASGATANEDLTQVFKLSAQTGENVFNVSVNGINGVIQVPPGSYVGSTLAEALQTRINQIADPVTGDTIGGVSVQYNVDDNNLIFTTGTTGTGSTIKVKGIARLGLADVPLGVGSVPEIYNLVQATNAEGAALYVNAEGEVVQSPPDEIVEGYYPLYIDEGELTFDKSGKLVSPKNKIHYEKAEEGFSIALDIDFSDSTQFAQPFSVLSVTQNGNTSGRLDGLEIDSSGTIRANYTNGENNPLGKIVMANFNNQNGLTQIGNATYTETAVSGPPQVGEAGSEGFGNILSGSLERSNVDITEELVNLITAQRNFQASAKAIETTTGLTQTIINIRM